MALGLTAKATSPSLQLKTNFATGDWLSGAFLDHHVVSEAGGKAGTCPALIFVLVVSAVPVIVPGELIEIADLELGAASSAARVAELSAADEDTVRTN